MIARAADVPVLTSWLAWHASRMATERQGTIRTHLCAILATQQIMNACVLRVSRVLVGRPIQPEWPARPGHLGSLCQRLHFSVSAVQHGTCDSQHNGLLKAGLCQHPNRRSLNTLKPLHPVLLSPQPTEPACTETTETTNSSDESAPCRRQRRFPARSGRCCSPRATRR